MNFPGLVIDPWETDKKRDADNHVIVRSFRDSRLHSIPFKYIEDFDRDMRSDKPQLQIAIDLANAYITDNVLPKSWTVTFFQIYKDIVEYLQDDTVPIRVTTGQFIIETGRLFLAVWSLGGFDYVVQNKLWPIIYKQSSKSFSNWDSNPSASFVSKMKAEYRKYLMRYEEAFESRLAHSEDNPLPKMNSRSKSDQKLNSSDVQSELLLKFEEGDTTVEASVRK